MPRPIHVPRVNNNDDVVQIVGVNVKAGDFVRSGQVVAAVETDKAVVDVEAESDGYVLEVLHQVRETANVGAVLLWLGERADEPVPAPVETGDGNTGEQTVRPTAKARAMLKELGITADRIPAAGQRLTAADVEAWLATNRAPLAAAKSAVPSSASEPLPEVAGELQDLSPEAHGMLATVLWHRDHVAQGYVEIEYDPKPWDEHAKSYATGHKLLLPPLLPLLAFRLVEIAREFPGINATVVDGRRYQYRPVNLGFTVQAGRTLFLTVIHEAHAMNVADFIGAMGEIQRRAMAHKLAAAEMTGATVAFSSMARWNVSRHVPILPPRTSLIVAHAASRGSNTAVLGASYDHRLLSGHDVVQVLQLLARPPRQHTEEQA